VIERAENDMYFIR